MLCRAAELEGVFFLNIFAIFQNHNDNNNDNNNHNDDNNDNNNLAFQRAAGQLEQGRHVVAILHELQQQRVGGIAP